MTDPTQDKREQALHEIVFAQRLRLYFDSLRTSAIAVLVNSTLLTVLLWDRLPRSVLLSWYVISLLVAGYRVFTAQGFDRHEKEADQQNRWYRAMLVGSVLSGLVWGTAGFLLFSPQDVMVQALLAFVIAGMSAGGIISLATFLEASLPFLVIVILPYTGRLLLEETTVGNYMAIMAVLYLFLMSLFARRIHNTVVEALSMKFLQQWAQDKIHQQAYYDELTGLPNRRMLRDRLTQAYARAQRSGTHLAVLFLDLDNFKRINDSLGHGIGDALLTQAAARLRDQLRKEDTAARLGGDEFVVVLTDIAGDQSHAIASVQHTAERIRSALDQPFDVEGHELHVSASIGVSMFPGESEGVDELLKHADTAMYRAKEAGRNAIRFFMQQMQDTLDKRLRMEKALRAAIDGGELELYFQPQIDLERGVYGGEALLRWNRDGEIIGPDEFIPVAEESGLISQLGDWVLAECCQCLSQLGQAPTGDAPISLSLNISPREFRQQKFAERLLSALAARDVDPSLLCIEVTENLLIENRRGTINTMNRLREQGMSFSIDDFGTGYSSLLYLKQLPLDALKIDKSFVRDVLSDANDASIVKTIISMAGLLGLQVIAEGVENRGVFEFLSEAGCQRFQGYLFAEPMPMQRFIEYVVEQRGLQATELAGACSGGT
jgi:diguanylate cyclase (GGDEF)-like protein